jgi:hypothetical protein
MHVATGRLGSAVAPAAGLGFRIKSGWATVVLLGGTPDRPELLDRRRVDLSDPARAELRQPYHAAMGVGLTDEATVRRRTEAIQRYSDNSLARMISDFRKEGIVLTGAGLVVGSDLDPERIGNQHIRAHALEGRLFRQVVEAAMDRAGLPYSAWVERTLYGAAAQQLGRSEAQIRKAVTELGHRPTGGWRSDDKMAAVAAWVVLRGSRH